MKRDENSLRIIAGQWRSRVLKFPDAPGLRPTPDRVRETLFNWLQAHIPGETCLDLFAGSGACGIEALSRGAAAVTFLELSPPAAASIRSNLALLGAGNAEVLQQDALGWLQANQQQAGGSGKEKRHYGLVFMDPPFSERLHARSCALLESSGLLKDGALIYLENEEPVPASALPQHWEVLKSKRAGAVHFALYRRGRPQQAEDRQATGAGDV